MKATLTNSTQRDAKNYQSTMETTNKLQLVVSLPKQRELAPVLTVHWYASRSGDGASPLYCSFWCTTRLGDSFSASGRATGYGYHKESSAFQDALDNAGVMLDKDIGTVGDRAIREAMTAIGAAAGYGRLKQAIV